jgi:hypothetical protein
MILKTKLIRVALTSLKNSFVGQNIHLGIVVIEIENLNTRCVIRFWADWDQVQELNIQKKSKMNTIMISGVKVAVACQVNHSVPASGILPYLCKQKSSRSSKKNKSLFIFFKFQCFILFYHFYIYSHVISTRPIH